MKFSVINLPLVMNEGNYPSGNQISYIIRKGNCKGTHQRNTVTWTSDTSNHIQKN